MYFQQTELYWYFVHSSYQLWAVQSTFTNCVRVWSHCDVIAPLIDFCFCFITLARRCTHYRNLAQIFKVLIHSFEYALLFQNMIERSGIGCVTSSGIGSWSSWRQVLAPNAINPSRCFLKAIVKAGHQPVTGGPSRPAVNWKMFSRRIRCASGSLFI